MADTYQTENGNDPLFKHTFAFSWALLERWGWYMSTYPEVSCVAPEFIWLGTERVSHRWWVASTTIEGRIETTIRALGRVEYSTIAEVSRWPHTKFYVSLCLLEVWSQRSRRDAQAGSWAVDARFYLSLSTCLQKRIRAPRSLKQSNI